MKKTILATLVVGSTLVSTAQSFISKNVSYGVNIAVGAGLVAP